jgi:hypothetical protein
VAKTEEVAGITENTMEKWILHEQIHMAFINRDPFVLGLFFNIEIVHQGLEVRQLGVEYHLFSLKKSASSLMHL